MRADEAVDVAAGAPDAAAVEALIPGVGASDAVVLVRPEVMAVDSVAAVDPGAPIVAFGWSEVPAGRLAAISAFKRARLLCRTCRAAATMTAVIAANAIHNRAMPHSLRFGRPTRTGTVAAIVGAPTDPDISSADFTAPTN